MVPSWLQKTEWLFKRTITQTSSLCVATLTKWKWIFFSSLLEGGKWFYCNFQKVMSNWPSHSLIQNLRKQKWDSFFHNSVILFNDLVNYSIKEVLMYISHWLNSHLIKAKLTCLILVVELNPFPTNKYKNNKLHDHKLYTKNTSGISINICYAIFHKFMKGNLTVFNLCAPSPPNCVTKGQLLNSRHN